MKFVVAFKTCISFEEKKSPVNLINLQLEPQFNSSSKKHNQVRLGLHFDLDWLWPEV